MRADLLDLTCQPAAAPVLAGATPKTEPGPARRFLRKAIHFFSYHLILTRQRTTATEVA
jgi:hypothetical protein